MKHIILDTSYLLYLFNVDNHSNDYANGVIKERFRNEYASDSVFYVPVPVIFELCNFIAQVASGTRRRNLAHEVKSAIEGSLQNTIPWTILPFEGDNSMTDWVTVLNDALTVFNNEYVQSEIGLTDIAVIRQSNSLRTAVSNRPQPRPLVHIWTTDHVLKSHEPDTERNAFVG